jgi:hypothetical protein
LSDWKITAAVVQLGSFLANARAAASQSAYRGFLGFEFLFYLCLLLYLPPTSRFCCWWNHFTATL